MPDKPKAIAFMVGGPIADDDPYRAIKERALAISDAAEAWEGAARSAAVDVRADAVGALVDALACESLDIVATCDASGLPESGVDAATYVALTLRLAELGGLSGDE